MAIMNPKIIKIKTFLQDSKYYIPEYQREYSWDEKDQISDFWKDLKELVDEVRDYHFLGQVMIHNDEEEKKLYIIDGQQRATTSIILIAAFRKIYEELATEFKLEDAKFDEEDIRNALIGRYSQKRDDLRLYTGKIDKDFFKNHIQLGKPILSEKTKSILTAYTVEDLNTYLKYIKTGNDKKIKIDKRLVRKLSNIDEVTIRNFLNPEFEYLSEPIIPSHIRIMQAYSYFYKEINSLIKNTPLKPEEQLEILSHWYNSFIEKFKIMYLEILDISEAFVIFETLNARGKSLETADLLKNHLLKNAGSKYVEQVEELWVDLQEQAIDVNLTQYIRYYWNSKNTFSREKDLYKKLKMKIDTSYKSFQFVKDLNETMKAYRLLENPDTSSLYEKKICEKVNNLKIMNAQTYYPIFLALHNKHYREKDILEVLTMLENFYFRNCVIAGNTANSYELTFAKIALKISNEDLSIENIGKEFKKDLHSDKDFEEIFKLASIKTHPVAKYMLREIVDFDLKETKVTKDNKKIHLEHIMPKKFEKWEKEDYELRRILDEKLKKASDAEKAAVQVEIDDLGDLFDFNNEVNKIGNLTLLYDELNREIQNSIFEEKKIKYKDSEIPMTKDLTEYSRWNADAIQKRQMMLFEKVVQIWKNPL